MIDEPTGRVGPSRDTHAKQMADYHEEGLRLARQLRNRGPMLFDADGRLDASIMAAYLERGYYIFEGVVSGDEVAELRTDTELMLARAPISPDSSVDALGRTALGIDAVHTPYTLIKPLSDSIALKSAGQYPGKMVEPSPDLGAPEYVVHTMRGMCQYMPAGLRLYGHPHLLAAAASINGDDFVPSNDVIFVKQPGLGGSVAWHQDGVTHWNAASWGVGIHGFNYQVQLYPTTAANALWVVPGSHRGGRIDIARLMADNGGSEQLPGAIPLVCAVGDVTIVDRQMLHGSFANSSSDMRISITFGFHRYRAVLGAKTVLGLDQEGTYTSERIAKRSSIIAVAIDARRQYYPHESSFQYLPLTALADSYRYDPETFEAVIRNYNANDLLI